jgi:hypothetical protein
VHTSARFCSFRTDRRHLKLDFDGTGLLKLESAFEGLTLFPAVMEAAEHQMVATRLQFDGLTWLDRRSWSSDAPRPMLRQEEIPQ